MPQTLSKELRNLYRKERFLVLNFAAGEGDGRPPLSLAFRKSIRASLDLNHPIPANAFWAIDYHLDWIRAAVELSTSSAPRTEPLPGKLLGTQEDVDLLVAYPHAGRTVLILIEAKGVTGWNQKQLNSKVNTLRQIFGNGRRGLLLRWALAAPEKNPPINIDCNNWPPWMRKRSKPYWIAIPMPFRVDRLERCDSKGRRNTRGGYWRVTPEPASRRSQHTESGSARPS